MNHSRIIEVVKSQIRKNKYFFCGVGITLIAETVIALLMPQILSKIIDNLAIESKKWLYAITIIFCTFVLFKSGMSILNTYLNEKLGWRLCDCLREDMFKRIYTFSVGQHKSVKTGEFLERLEGDVNILSVFFSSMLIDIISSSLLVAGILFVFYQKSVVLGIIFTILSVTIMLFFIKTQEAISLLWRSAREKETEVLGEFTQAIEARKDIVGLKKETYILKRFDDKYENYKKNQIKASFIGNIPATVFFPY